MIGLHACAPVWMITPVKPLETAKTRLAGVLSARERRILVLAMFRDVLVAARVCGELAGLCVVTSDPQASTIAYRNGAVVIPDPPGGGLNNAFEAGAALARRMGAQGVLFLPADLPLIQPEDISAMVQHHGRTAMVRMLAAARDGGTNAMALWPPDAIAPSFGEASLIAHLRAAIRAGVELDLPELPRLALDVDRPADITELSAHRPGRNTRRALSALQVLRSHTAQQVRLHRGEAAIRLVE